jgi:hypothetical protein
VFLLFCQLALAQPSAAQLAAAWAGHQAAIEHSALFALELTAEDFKTMAQAKVARRRLPAKGADRAMGAVWTPLGRDTVWVAIQDDRDFKLFDDLTEARLPGSTWDHKLLYQHLDAPWPITDRHWVLEIKNNTAISTRTKDRIWERVWNLAQESMVPEGCTEAIWTPINDGGWMLIEAAGGTLVVYHARSKVGGNIPQEAITAWAMSTLDGLMKTILSRAEGIQAHYTKGHELIFRPDGSTVPTW